MERVNNIYVFGYMPLDTLSIYLYLCIFIYLEKIFVDMLSIGCIHEL